MALRMIDAVGLEPPTLSSGVARTTRARAKKDASDPTKVLRVNPVDRTDRKDYIIRLFLMADRDDITTINKVAFKPQKVKAWVKNVNQGIKKKMAMNKNKK